jgi:hypothetical protein
MGDFRLVVVRRGHFATFELLTRTFAGDPSVQIMWDRRMGERRQAMGERRQATEGCDKGERRRRERRRMPQTRWEQLNYIIAPATPS